jgi:hypothetical protein
LEASEQTHQGPVTKGDGDIPSGHGFGEATDAQVGPVRQTPHTQDPFTWRPKGKQGSGSKIKKGDDDGDGDGDGEEEKEEDGKEGLLWSWMTTTPLGWISTVPHDSQGASQEDE